MDTPSSPDAYPRLALVLALFAGLVFVRAAPFDWASTTPLPWDPASHLENAFQVRDAWRHGSFDEFVAAIRAPDQYPPLHAIALGTWTAWIGSDVGAWLGFGFAVHVATVFLLAWRWPVAGALFAAWVMSSALAPALMVEGLAALGLAVVVWSLRTQDEILSYGRIAVLVAATCGVLLTKDNLGLPLLPALVAAGFVARTRRARIALFVAAAASAVVWIAYLSFQHDGWTRFAEFATNRSNAPSSSAGERLVSYARLFATMFVGPAVAGFVVLAVGVAGVVRGATLRPSMVTTVVLVYVTATLVALARHEYVLSRNLSGVAVMVAVAIGIAVARLEGRPTRRWATWTAVAAATCLVLVNLPARIQMQERWYPESSRALRVVSDRIVEAAAGHDRIRIVGTFAEFGGGWIRLLRRGDLDTPSVKIDAPYPLTRRRTGLSAEAHPAYAQQVDAWTHDGTERVLALTLTAASRYRSLDHALWSAWKENLVRAALENENFHVVARDTLAHGVVLTILDVHRPDGVAETVAVDPPVRSTPIPR